MESTSSINPAHRSAGVDPVTSPQSSEWQGSFAAYRQAFARIQQSPQLPLLYAGASAMATLIASIMQQLHVVHTIHIAGSVAIEPANVLDIIVGIVFALALPRYGLALAERRKSKLNTLFQPNVTLFIFYVLTTLLTSIAIVLSIAALFVPFIWVFAWFALADFAVVDKNFAPLQAMRHCREISKNQKAKIWGYAGTTVLAYIAAAIVLGILGGIIANAIPNAYVSSFVDALLSGIIAFVAVGVFAVGASLYRWLDTHQANVATEEAAAGDMTSVLG